MGSACVIGACRFICKRFDAEGNDFFIVDKRQSQTFQHKTRIADVRDIAALRAMVERDVIINLAAEHRKIIVFLRLANLSQP